MILRTTYLRLALVLLAVCGWVLGFSQQSSHVKWTISAGKADAGGVQKLDLHAQIEPGWHLYSIVPVKGEGPVPTAITVKPPLTLAGQVQESKPISKLDPNFNLVVNFFQDKADFTVPVKGDVSPTSSLDVKFQLCNDTTCIPPTTVKVTVGGGGGATPVGAAKPAAADDDYSKQIQQAKNRGLLAFLLFSFTAGLLSLLTPCVFPMIPITVSYFSKRRGDPAIKTSLAQPIAYCVGIVGSFTLFGVLVSVLFGASGIQRFATNPYVNMALAALFIVLALSLLGIYQINLPSGLVNKFNGSNGKGGLLAPALMGLTFTLTSFTCTVAFVGTILASASQGDIVYPLLGMLAYGTAFALPFFLLALFPQYLAKLPKSGSWLETVKAFMGFIEVAAALKFLSNADLVLQTNLISRPLFLGTWAFIAFAAGLFLIGVLPLPNMERAKKLGPWRLGFAVGSIVLAIWFTISVPGRSLGELEAFMPPTDHGWVKSYNDAVALAQRTNRPIFVNFTGVTCTNCRWMESNMFSQPTVKEALGKYVTVELYTDRETAGDMANKALEEKLTGTDSLPEYVELTPDGKKVADFPGLTRSRDEFISFLKRSSVSGLQAQR